jgi:hypothetical protein
MWVQDDARSDISQIDLMSEARAMRDATVARYLAIAWHGIANLSARLLHVGHGQTRTN